MKMRIPIHRQKIPVHRIALRLQAAARIGAAIQDVDVARWHLRIFNQVQRGAQRGNSTADEVRFAVL
jgi:hypothetical protein